MINDVITTYPVLKVGSRGTEVMSLQRALMSKNYLPAGEDDGIYGAKTMAAVQAFQAANGLTANGVADATTQAKLYGTYTGTNSSAMKGNVYSLDWFANGYDLINAFPNISIYDCNTGIMWNAKYINGRNHADIIPASAADAQLLTAYNITGSYVRPSLHRHHQRHQVRRLDVRGGPRNNELLRLVQRRHVYPLHGQQDAHLREGGR